MVSNSLAALSGSTAERVYCNSLNISVCAITESSKKVKSRLRFSPSTFLTHGCLLQFSVNVFNPLARPVSWPVRLPVNGTAYAVADANGKAVDCEVIPVSGTTRDARRNRGFAVNELLFRVRAPPLGFSTYSVSLLQDGPLLASPRYHVPKSIWNKV